MKKKIKSGYQITNTGLVLATKLVSKFGQKTQDRYENDLHVVRGKITGQKIDELKIKEIAEYLTGKWFGDFRFIAKSILKDGSAEIEWCSTNNLFGAKFILKNMNKVVLVLSSPKRYDNELKFQLFNQQIISFFREIF